MNKKTIVFYNMNKLLKLTDNKSYKIRPILKSTTEISGTSYLLNLNDLLNDTVDDFYIASYIYLASYRNYADYKLLGIKYLDISLIPDINLERYKDNPLLSFEANKIKFKYEER